MAYSGKAPTRLGSNLMRGASLSVIALITASPAFAQDDNLETVVVTGTLLKGINPVGTNIVNFTSADIKATGGITTDQILSNVPQLSNAFDVDAAASTGINPAGGSGTYNRPKLRNLSGGGGAATLFLVNGHNLVGEGFIATTPDGGEIPALVLQRVDVIADGGSALYGSDAVAGTINFITRTSYEGLYGETHYGTTGNMDQYQVGVMGGHSWSSGSAYMAYEYRNSSTQLKGDRAYLRENLIPLGGTIDARVKTCPMTNIQPNGAGTTYGLSSYPSNTAGSVKAAATNVGGNLCDNGLGASAFPQDTMHSFFGSFTQRLGEGYDFSMTAWFGRHLDTSYAGPFSSSNVTITNANPFFQAIGTETKQTVSFDWSSVFGNQTQSWSTLEQYQIEPELKMQFGGTWTGDLFLNYGRSAAVDQSYSTNAVYVNNALVNSNPAYAIDPYNLALSGPGVLNDATAWGGHYRGNQQQEQIRFETDGSVYTLPGGDIRLAAGLQYEYDDARGLGCTNQISRCYESASLASPGGVIIVGNAHRTIQSVFGELFVPVFGDGNELPFIHSLNFDASARFDRYSDFGSTTNPKIGFTYVPIPGLSIRGNMGKSFNAPSLDDSASAIDAKASLQGSSTVRPAVGSMYGPATQAEDTANANRPAIQLAGGTAGLQPQVANTWSYGFDYSPDFVDGLSLSLTRWHISLYHAINMTPYTSAPVLYTPAYSRFFIINPTLAQVNAMAVGLPQPGTPYATAYQNGAANTPYVVIDARRYNLGNQFDTGWDFSARYDMQTDWGSMEFGATGTDYTNIQIQGPGGGAMIDQISNNVAPYQISGYIGGQWGALHARATMNYSAGFSLAGVTNQTHAGAFMPVNLAIDYDLDGSYSWTSGATVSLNVNNLFDENPPFLNNSSGLNVAGPAVGGTVNGVTIGRLFEFGFTKKF